GRNVETAYGDIVGRCSDLAAIDIKHLSRSLPALENSAVDGVYLQRIGGNEVVVERRVVILDQCGQAAGVARDGGGATNAGISSGKARRSTRYIRGRGDCARCRSSDEKTSIACERHTRVF